MAEDSLLAQLIERLLWRKLRLKIKSSAAIETATQSRHWELMYRSLLRAQLESWPNYVRHSGLAAGKSRTRALYPGYDVVVEKI